MQAILRLRAQPLLKSLSPGPVLVVAPHPDDEALGCGRLIVTLRNRGVEVEIVWLTDGEASHTDFPGGQAALRALRRAEARVAGEILGVPAHCLHHLGAPDGRLPHLDSTQRHDVLSGLVHLIERLSPGTVFVTSSLDDSTEHTAAYGLVGDALRIASHRAELRTYLVWSYWKIRSLWIIVLRGPHLAFLAAPTATTAVRNRAVMAHRTQVTAWSDQGDVSLSPHFLACFPRTGEFFLST